MTPPELHLVPLVLVVEDDDCIRDLLVLQLVRAGYRAIAASDGAHGLDLAVSESPDLVISDIAMPGLDGNALCRALTALPTPAPPVILLTALTDPAERVAGLDAGAVDYIVKPFDASELLARVRAALRVKSAQDALRSEAATDPLTGLVNRRELESRVRAALEAALPHGRPVSCLMLDVDRFKELNDTHGHGAGDDALRSLAARLSGVARGSDVVGRYGGDEFALLLPDTDTEGAQTLARRLVTLAAAEPAGGSELTISVGVATWDGSSDDPALLLAAADSALLRAKRGGRDRIETAEAVVAVTAFDDMADAARPLRALVVDDEPDIRELIAHCLKSDGYEVVEAADGIEALELALTARPDVAVLDVMMPGLNGLEVAAQLRSTPATAGIPIMFLTARTRDEDMIRGLLVGGDDYVRKPFRPAEFRTRMRDVLAA